MYQKMELRIASDFNFNFISALSAVSAVENCEKRLKSQLSGCNRVIKLTETALVKGILLVTGSGDVI